MSNNLFNSEVAVRLGSSINDSALNLFQTLEGRTLCVLGPSHKGKAFVPTNITNTETLDVAGTTFKVANSLDNKLGNARSNRHRHIKDSLSCYTESQSYDAIKTWLDNGGDQSTFIRLLGIGSGKKSIEGNYTGAGFNAEGIVSQNSEDNLTKSNNPFVETPITVSGNVSFILQKFINNQSGYLEDLGLNTANNNYFITSTIISAQGVLPSLLVNEGTPLTTNDSIEAASYNNQVRSSSTINPKILLLGLNSGFVTGTENTRLLNVSNEFVINNDLTVLQSSNRYSDFFLEKGHIKYAEFTSSGFLRSDNDIKIITTRNFSTLNNSNLPDYNSFENKYQTAKTPWVTSQPIDRNGLLNTRENIQTKVVNLFKFHALDDGEVGNRFRIKINPLTRGNIDENTYATFEIYIFEYDPRDNTFTQVDHKQEVNLNPDSPNYIARLFGDENTYYHIESNKTVTELKYETRNLYLRVEVDQDVENKKIRCDLIPSGFRAYPHIRINPNCFLDYNDLNLDFNNVYQMPIHYTNAELNDNIMSDISASIQNSWGVLFNSYKKLSDSNNVEVFKDYLDEYISPFYYYTKYFLHDLNTESKNIWVEDDSYLNSFFHLEKIYHNGTFDNLKYTRKAAEGNTYLNLDDNSLWVEDDKTLVAKLQDKLSFDFFTYGGFDGVDIRDTDKKFFTNTALIREEHLEDSNISLRDNPTIKAYLTAIDVVKNRELNLDYLLLPGVSNKVLTREIIDYAEDEKDFLFISDVFSYSDTITDGLLIEETNDNITNKLKSNFSVTLVKNKLSDYIKDAEEFTDINIFPTESKDNNNIIFSNTISYLQSLGLNSKYAFYTFGSLKASDADDNIKLLDPSIFVIKKIAQDLGNITQPLTVSETINNYSSLKILQPGLNNSDVNWESNKKLFRSNLLNPLYYSSNKIINLDSQVTSYEQRLSSFSLFSIVNNLLKVKKEVKLALLTQSVPGSLFRGGPLFFNQNSSQSNLYLNIKLMINNILDNLVNNGVIVGYNVIIPNRLDDRIILDAERNIFRGTINLEFNNNIKINNLRIDDILYEYSLIETSNLNRIQAPQI